MLIYSLLSVNEVKAVVTSPIPGDLLFCWFSVNPKIVHSTPRGLVELQISRMRCDKLGLKKKTNKMVHLKESVTTDFSIAEKIYWVVKVQQTISFLLFLHYLLA